MIEATNSSPRGSAKQAVPPLSLHMVTSEDGESQGSGGVERDKKSNTDSHATMNLGEGYRRILDTVGTPGYPSIRALFYGEDGPPADTIPGMTVSFELFEAVQTRFATTKLALERVRVDLHTRHQQYAALESQHEQLQLNFKIMETRAGELEKKNTQLHQTIAKQDVTLEQMRQNVKHIKEEMSLMEEKMIKRDNELQVAQNRVADGLVALSQKETIIANLLRQLGRGGRSAANAHANGTGARDAEDEEYSAEALQRIADDVEGRSIEAQLRLFIVELEARIKTKEDEKKYVMLRHTMYRRHVRAIVEAYETLCMTKEDATASHVCDSEPIAPIPSYRGEEKSPTTHDSNVLIPNNTALYMSHPGFPEILVSDRGSVPQEELFMDHGTPIELGNMETADATTYSMPFDAMNSDLESDSTMRGQQSQQQRERLGSEKRTQSMSQGAAVVARSGSLSPEPVRSPISRSAERRKQEKSKQQQQQKQKTVQRRDTGGSRGRLEQHSSPNSQSKSNLLSDSTLQRQDLQSQSLSGKVQSSASLPSEPSQPRPLHMPTAPNRAASVVVSRSNRAATAPVGGKLSKYIVRDDESDRTQPNQNPQNPPEGASEKTPASPSANRHMRSLVRSYSALHDALARLEKVVFDEPRGSRTVSPSFADDSNASAQAARLTEAADADTHLIEQVLRALQRGAKLRVPPAAHRAGRQQEPLPTKPKAQRHETPEATPGSSSETPLGTPASRLAEGSQVPSRRSTRGSSPAVAAAAAGSLTAAKEKSAAGKSPVSQGSAGLSPFVRQGVTPPEFASAISQPSRSISAEAGESGVSSQREDSAVGKLEEQGKEKIKEKETKGAIVQKRISVKPAAKRDTPTSHLPAISSRPTSSSQPAPQKSQQEKPMQKQRQQQQPSGKRGSSVSRETSHAHEKTTTADEYPQDLPPSSPSNQPPYEEQGYVTVTGDVTGQQQNVEKERPFSDDTLEPIPGRQDYTRTYQFAGRLPPSTKDNNDAQPSFAPTLPRVSHPGELQREEAVQPRPRFERMSWKTTAVRVDQQSGLPSMDTEDMSKHSTLFQRLLGNVGMHNGGEAHRGQMPGPARMGEVPYLTPQKNFRSAATRQQYGTRMPNMPSPGGTAMSPTGRFLPPTAIPVAPSQGPRQNQHFPMQFSGYPNMPQQQAQFDAPMASDVWFYPSQEPNRMGDMGLYFNAFTTAPRGLSVAGHGLTTETEGFHAPPFQPMPAFAPLAGRRVSFEQVLRRIRRQGAMHPVDYRELYHVRQQPFRGGAGVYGWPQRRLSNAQQRTVYLSENAPGGMGPTPHQTAELVYRLHRRNQFRKSRPMRSALSFHLKTNHTNPQTAPANVQTTRANSSDLGSRKARRAGWARRSPPVSPLRKQWFRPKPKRGDRILYEYSPFMIKSLGGSSSPTPPDNQRGQM